MVSLKRCVVQGSNIRTIDEHSIFLTERRSRPGSRGLLNRATRPSPRSVLLRTGQEPALTPSRGRGSARASGPIPGRAVRRDQTGWSTVSRSRNLQRTTLSHRFHVVCLEHLATKVERRRRPAWALPPRALVAFRLERVDRSWLSSQYTCIGIKLCAAKSLSVWWIRRSGRCGRGFYVLA
jgi:hypothetical protein